MRVNCGDLAINVDGEQFVFRPTFANCQKLGSPERIVELFADSYFAGIDEINELFANEQARSIFNKCLSACFLALVSCSERDDIGFLGELKPCKSGVKFVQRSIPVSDIIHLGRHLMKHMLIGEPDEDAEKSGEYSNEFDPGEFIDAAILHFGLTEDQAENLSMTRFQKLMRMKYPKPKTPEPTNKEHDDCMSWLAEVNAKREAMH